MSDEICVQFATKLKELREAKGLSKAKLSTLMDCDISYIGKIENCEKFPSLKMIGKIAVALDVHPKELFDF